MLINNVLELHAPKKDPLLPLVFDSPHSGTYYPDDFNYACDRNSLERGEDKHVNDLFSAAPTYGACLLNALFSCNYVDVNRTVDDIDHALFDAPWPYDDMPINPTKRSYAGIGLIRRLTNSREPIYNKKLSPEEIKSRIETYYIPYHNTLDKIITQTHQTFGQVWHINCHSMPSLTIQPPQTATMTRVNPAIQPDFILGDRNGTSCDLHFTHEMRDFLRDKGYIVAINNPYQGVELVERYSQPSIGRHSIQIEISRSLYMDEKTFKKNKNYDAFKTDITDLIAFCADYARANLIPLAAD